MEVCCNNRQAVVAKVRKSNQSPVYDTFGPFPDETLLSSIDRLLFFVGASRVQRALCLPTPFTDSDSDCSIEISECPVEVCNICRPKKKCCCSPVSVRKQCSCPKCCSPRPICTCSSTGTSTKSCLSRVTYSEPPHIRIGDGGAISMTSPRKKVNVMKRSFSMCSLACRKLKEKLSCQSKVGAPKWLWTRLQCRSDGSEIYEVFKDSNICTHPSDIENENTPKLIFVVLPNGSIVPFESLSCH